MNLLSELFTIRDSRQISLDVLYFFQYHPIVHQDFRLHAQFQNHDKMPVYHSNKLPCYVNVENYRSEMSIYLNSLEQHTLERNVLRKHLEWIYTTAKKYLSAIILF